QRLTYLPQQMNGSCGRQRTILLDHVLQIHARQVFHDIIKRAVVRVPIIIDLDRVRVGQGRGRLYFALEAHEGPGIAGLVGADQLDGTRAAQEDMLGQVDGPHAPKAQHLLEPTLTETLGLVGLLAQRASYANRTRQSPRMWPSK